MGQFMARTWAAARPALSVPEGPVLGQLAIQYVTNKGGVASRDWPPRVFRSVRVALDVGHEVAKHNRLGTYMLEFEIFREEPAT